MKIRTNFVSNSSSSSFVILQTKPSTSFEELVEISRAALKKENEEYEEESEEFDLDWNNKGWRYGHAKEYAEKDQCIIHCEELDWNNDPDDIESLLQGTLDALGITDKISIGILPN